MNNHIYKPDNNKPFHSNGYAVVANGDQLGAVSTVSFEKRQQIDQNRRLVGGYNRSSIGRSYNESLRAKSVQDSTQRVLGSTQRGSLQGYNSRNTAPMRSQGFHEPNARRYNPYG